MGGRHRSGEILRSSQPRSSDVPCGRTCRRQAIAETHLGVSNRRSDGRRAAESCRRRHAARRSFVAVTLEPCARRFGSRVGKARSPLLPLCRRPQHSRSQSAGGGTGDGRRLPVSHEETPAQSHQIEECGGSTRRSEVLGLSLDDRCGTSAIDIAGGSAKVPGASTRADEQDTRDQYRADDRFVEAVSARPAELLWLQPGPVGASQPGCADPPETPHGDLAAVGERVDSIRQLTAIGCAPHASGCSRRLPDWLVGDVATCGRSASTAQCLFRLARPSQSVGISERLTRPNRRGTDPYARWCDRESSRGPTYVDHIRFQPAIGALRA